MDQQIDNTQDAPQTDDVDTILEQIQQENAPKQPEAAPAPKVEEYSFIHNGKEIKADRDKLIRWAQQGYDAPNRLGEMNKKLQEYTKKEAQLKEWEQKYAPVQDFVQKNPEFYQKYLAEVEQQRAQIPVAVLDPLKQEIDQLKNGFQTLEQERAAEKARQEDEIYQKEVGEIKKQYPKVDFDSKDQSGQSLEYRVLQYAIENGIKKFTTAFRDYYHDNLLKMAEETAKEKAIASKQRSVRQGILDVASYPSRKPTTGYTNSKSYNDLLREAIEEYT